MNNDKIDALWAQSIKTVEVPMPNEIYKLGEGIFRRYETYDHIKFAELIVRECRDIVEQDMKLAHIQMIPLTLEKYANSRLREKIREHFGVEE